MEITMREDKTGVHELSEQDCRLDVIQVSDNIIVIFIKSSNGLRTFDIVQVDSDTPLNIVPTGRFKEQVNHKIHRGNPDRIKSMMALKCKLLIQQLDEHLYSLKITGETYEASALVGSEQGKKVTMKEAKNAGNV